MNDNRAGVAILAITLIAILTNKWIDSQGESCNNAVWSAPYTNNNPIVNL